MPTTEPVATRPKGGHRARLYGWRIVAAFAVTQTVGYGALYYSFAVLLHPMTVDLHASPTQVTGAFTAAILAWAVVAVPVGRWLDRHGGRAVMTCGSLLGTGLLIAWSQVRTITQLYAVLIGLGGCMAMALYEAATAVIVSWFDPERRPRALLAMIVVAGFASTIFLPLTGLLVDHHGWRDALLVLAAIHGMITIPLHGLVVRGPPPHHATTRQSTAAGRGLVVRAALRDSRCWFLAAAFVAHSAAMSAMTLHLVGFLTHAGHPATFAATIAGLLGVLSVTGRLLLTGARRRIRLTTLVAGIFGVQAAAAICPPFIAATRVGAVAGVTAFGDRVRCGQPRRTRDARRPVRHRRLRHHRGVLATPVTLAKAGAPLTAAALLTTLGDYTPVLVAISATCAVAAVGIRGKATSAPPVTGG